MNPGIGSTRRIDSDPVSTGDRCQRSFEFSLDRPCSRLNLEPGEVRAVVFNPCPVPHGHALSDAHLPPLCRRIAALAWRLWFSWLHQLDLNDVSSVAI